jgi:hypothetical protein
MKLPTKKAPGAGELTGRKLIAFVEYHALAFLAKLFAEPFWFFEQRRGWLMDQIENEKGRQ